MGQEIGIVTTKNKVDFRNNALNLVRLITAAKVFFGHATEHLEISNNFVSRMFSAIMLSVPMFFVLSGFLVWGSIERTSSFSNYLKKRILRLYPELWFGVLVSLISILLLYDNIVWRDIGLFAFTQGTFMQFWTPDSLRGFGCGTPNGALWTICTIVQFYLVAWFLRKLIKKKNVLAWIILLILSIAVAIIIPYTKPLFPSETLYKLFRQTLFSYFWIFLVGAFLSEFFDDLIPILKKFWYIGFILLLTVQLFIKKDIDASYPLFGSILCGVSWIGFAYAFPKLQIKHDISYGVYIYHMVFINIAVELGYVRSWWTFWVVLFATLAAAIVSYYTIGYFSRRKKTSIKLIENNV